MVETAAGTSSDSFTPGVKHERTIGMHPNRDNEHATIWGDLKRPRGAPKRFGLAIGVDPGNAIGYLAGAMSHYEQSRVRRVH